MTELFAILGMPGGMELLIVAFIILLLFGNRLPGVMRSLGRGITEFKGGLKGGDKNDDQDEDDQDVADQKALKKDAPREAPPSEAASNAAPAEKAAAEK